MKRFRKHQQKIASQRKGQPQQQRVAEEVIFNGSGFTTYVAGPFLLKKVTDEL